MNLKETNEVGTQKKEERNEVIIFSNLKNNKIYITPKFNNSYAIRIDFII